MYAITVFGDSITFARGDSLGRGWCGRLKKYFEEKDYYNCLYNLGIPGDTTKDLLKRFDTEAESRIKYNRKEDQHIIIFAIGTNDSKIWEKDKRQETNINIFRKNILTLINKSKNYTKEVTFIGLTPVDESKTLDYEGTTFTNERIKQFNNIIKEVCQKNKIPFLDMFKEISKLDYKKLLGDGLHPNPKGYENMYELIKEFLIKEKIID